MRSVSALTLAAGRAEHLANVIRGFEAQDRRPDELIVGVMQDTPYTDLPDTSFPVRQILVERTNGELNLAAARNRVGFAATGDVLVFVDVDCIPAPSLVADYAEACEPGRGLVMGEVLYLRHGMAGAALDYDRWAAEGVRHSDRQGPPAEGLRACEDYRCFWSLNFAMHRQDWHRSGGFHEGYYGYGGEDTDFGRILADRDIAIWWTKGARVYHQFHEHYMPPVHHVASVLRNANHFATRWGHRTMEHWLHAFCLMGLLERSGAELRVVREPSETDFALCRQRPDMPYANTRRVLDLLQSVPAHLSGAERTAQVERQQNDLLAVAAK